MSIRVESITKSWGNFTALRDISLDVHDHELLALLGPSGSGKTTLLRIVAGLETADHGEIYLHDENATHHHVRNRRIGFVFQHYAIFRHMTVFENIAFGLRVRPRKERPSETEIHHRVHELLNLVHIEQFANRKPSQLSGGQRQRVALARALAVQPKVLLLDEPFGALDARVRQELRGWLRNLQKELGITTVMVTHDQEEAMEVADRIVIMNEGRIEQAGSPNELWEHPANAFVFDFLGNSNLYHGLVHSGFIELPGWKMRSNGWPEGGEVDVGVRTFDVRIAPSRNGSGRVKRLISSGEFVRLEIELPQEKRLNAQIHKCDPSLIGVHEGTPIRVEPLKAFVFHDQVTTGVPLSVH